MNAPSILIVDDERSLATNFKRLFCQEGWEAEAVFDGMAALELLEQRSFEVVLLDMRMPKMDGFATFAGIQKIRPRICVVFFTAYGDVDSAVKALRNGAWSMVMKGPRFEQVFAEVDTARKQWREMEDLKNQAAAAERLDATRNLAQGVAHQIKNGLADCGWCLTEIDDSTTMSEVREAAGKLRGALAVTELSVNTLHNVWRVQSDQNLAFEVVVIADAARGGFDIALRHMGSPPCQARLLSKVSDTLKVRCASGMLPQVFENLFHNAMQAAGTNDLKIELTAETRDDFAVIRVTDNGRGFSTEVQGTAHLPFVTTKKGKMGSCPATNTGLGLFFVDEVARRCGGTMIYGNRQPQGAFVEFTLPLVK